jgi:hypothetical protein
MSGFNSSFESYVFQDYQEGTYTPTLSAGWTYVNAEGRWSRNGRIVTLTILITGGTSQASGGSTISTPPGLTPVKPGAGTAVNTSGTALGNGVVAVTTAGTVVNSSAISISAIDKLFVVHYEV